MISKDILRFFIYLAITFSPLYIVRFKIFGFPTTLLEVFVIFSFFLFLFVKFQNRNFRFVELFPHTEFDLPIFILLVSAFISLFISSDFRGGLGIFKAYFLEPAIFYYIVVSLFVSEKDVLLLISALVLASIWLSLLAALQAITGRFSFAPWELAQGRVVAVYNSANALGLFLGPVFSFLLSLVLLGRGKIIENKNYILLFSTTCFLIAPILILTKSKGTLFALFGSILFIIYFFLSKRLDIKRFLLLGLITVSIIVTAFCFSFFRQFGDLTPPISQDSYKGYDTLRIRFYLWEGTIGLILDHPFFGAGLDNFKELYSGNYVLPQYREPLQYPHNFILTVLSELGVLGMVAFIFLFWRIFETLKRIGSWGISFTAVFLYLFIHGLVDVPYFKNDLSLQFFIFLAFIQILKWNEAYL